MLRTKPMTHLNTFARLHIAGPSDAITLRELAASVHSDGRTEDRDWQSDLTNRDSHTILAMECQVAVGAAKIVHPAGSAIATLVWLGVAHSARRRGVGRLLIESALEHARGQGAAVVRLGSLALSPPALTLFTTSGFVERNYDGTRIVFERSLWNERGHRQTRTMTPHFYGSISARGSSGASLMVAMATIDSRFMTTPQVERVITAEIQQDKGADHDTLLGTANAAAHRAFNAAIHCALPPLAAHRRALGDGTVSTSTAMPTPEELFGLLSQRQVPLLRARFDRLAINGADENWIVVLGFDGLLFQIFDPRRPDQRDEAVTLAEMRTALTDKHATCLVISRG